jgi:hypothetical protein
MLISDNQLDIFNKLIDVCSKNICENELKINLIYQRLNENSCCPICYQVFDDINNKIYITNKCCNNKICGHCIDEWYKMDKNNCIFCNIENITKEDLLYYEKENNILNESKCNIDKNDYINFNSNKGDFLNDFINKLKNCDKKVIIFSDYSAIFQYIEKLCDENDVKYIDLDKGNIKDIDKSVYEYKYGNAKILLSNSTLFGCGMNFENSSTIIFVHKMDKSMEQQVIGRAQRLGRTSILNIIYLEYENETKYLKIDEDDEIDKNNSLSNFYNNMQIDNIIESISNLDFTMISSNEISDIDNMTLLEHDKIELPCIPSEPIDVNLEQLISNL